MAQTRKVVRVYYGIEAETLSTEEWTITMQWLPLFPDYSRHTHTHTQSYKLGENKVDHIVSASTQA